MEDLDRRGGGSHLHLLLRELIGHAVPVVVERDVIVDVDAVGFPVAILVTFGGQGAQRRLVERLEETAAGPLPLAGGPVVGGNPPFLNGLGGFRPTEKFFSSPGRPDPPPRPTHTPLPPSRFPRT